MTEESEQAIDWLLALFTGAYPQGRGKLGSILGGMCCLGVANHVNALGGDRLDPYLWSRWCLDDVAEWRLAGMNDGRSTDPFQRVRRKTHPEIAREILSNPHDFLPPQVAQDVLEFFTGPEDWRGWV